MSSLARMRLSLATAEGAPSASAKAMQPARHARERDVEKERRLVSTVRHGATIEPGVSLGTGELAAIDDLLCLTLHSDQPPAFFSTGGVAGFLSPAGAGLCVAPK